MAAATTLTVRLGELSDGMRAWPQWIIARDGVRGPEVSSSFRRLSTSQMHVSVGAKWLFGRVTQAGGGGGGGRCKQVSAIDNTCSRRLHARKLQM